MSAAIAEMLEKTEKLTVAEREELADRLMERLVRDIPPDVQRAQMAEVRRRVAQLESGEVSLVPGAEALAQVRRLVSAAVSIDRPRPAAPDLTRSAEPDAAVLGASELDPRWAGATVGACRK